jgi:hypothetical protein
MQFWGTNFARRWKSRTREDGFSGLEVKAFLGGAPAVFSECLFRERGCINRELKYIFYLFDLHDEGLDVHTLLPQSGGYLAWQSGAFGEMRPKLF